jgi:hypothetical protein
LLLLDEALELLDELEDEELLDELLDEEDELLEA